MNAVRNGIPPRPSPSPVGSGSNASGLTKRQFRRQKEKRRRPRKASPCLVVLVASHYLLPWNSLCLWLLFFFWDGAREHEICRENSGYGIRHGGRGRSSGCDALHGAAMEASGRPPDPLMRASRP
ncbi:hypothetical protein AAEP93_003342 [Penicillium crustosum]